MHKEMYNHMYNVELHYIKKVGNCASGREMLMLKEDNITMPKVPASSFLKGKMHN